MALYSDKTKPLVPSAKQMEKERNRFSLSSAALTAGSFAASLIPGVGGLISHGFERVDHGKKASEELNRLTRAYSTQIGTIVGKSADQVTVKDFKLAATMSKELNALYQEPIKKKKNKNRTSLMIGTAASAASFIPGGGAVVKVGEATVRGAQITNAAVQMGKQFLGAAAGGAVAGVLAKDKYSGQELVEAMEKNLAEADAKGIDRRQVVSPYLMFLLRVAQDPVLAKEIDAGVRKEFGKPLHNLTAQQMDGVMAVHKGLAEAVTREANALATGQDDIRSIAAGVPDIKGAYVAQADAMARTGNGMSHVARLNAQRAAARGANDNTVVANDHDSFVGRVNAGRTAAGKANELS